MKRSGSPAGSLLLIPGGFAVLASLTSALRRDEQVAA